VIGRIGLHPEVKVRGGDNDAWRLELPSGLKLELSIEGTGLTLAQEEGRYSPEFGITHPRSVLTWSFCGKLPVVVKTRLKSIPG